MYVSAKLLKSLEWLCLMVWPSSIIHTVVSMNQSCKYTKYFILTEYRHWKNLLHTAIWANQNWAGFCGRLDFISNYFTRFTNHYYIHARTWQGQCLEYLVFMTFVYQLCYTISSYSAIFCQVKHERSGTSKRSGRGLDLIRCVAKWIHFWSLEFNF